MRIEVWSPSEVYNYIGLYALARGKSKRSFLQKILDDWYDRAIQEAPTERLIDDIVFIAEKQWLTKPKRYPTFDTFLDQLEEELEKANIVPSARTRIIEKLDEATKGRPERASE